MQKRIRLIIDIGMTLLLPLLMAYSLISELFHEIIGTLIFFILDYLAVMILFMTVGCLVIRILNKVDKAQKKRRRIEK